MRCNFDLSSITEKKIPRLNCQRKLNQSPSPLIKCLPWGNSQSPLNPYLNYRRRGSSFLTSNRVLHVQIRVYVSVTEFLHRSRKKTEKRKKEKLSNRQAEAGSQANYVIINSGEVVCIVFRWHSTVVVLALSPAIIGFDEQTHGNNDNTYKKNGY